MEKLKNPDIRYIKDLEEVLYDKNWFKKTDNFPAYYMYRDLKRKNNLRYDVTIIPFNMFGKEFPKTKGHYHPEGYGEVYMVIEGEAIYLLQKKDLSDVVLIEAKKGDVVVIPPEYGHITINPGKSDLKMANWVSDDFESSYKEIEEKRGAAYFYTTEGWIKNKNYKDVPKIRSEEPEKEVPEDFTR